MVVEELSTSRAVDVAVHGNDTRVLMVAAHARSPLVRFATDTVIYRFAEEEQYP